ncbi:MAG: PEGA domain-containing protein [Proteobacteria bacterium]|nr:PEGA domain-containing protein [Pseudomonadota bacterium]
MKACKLCGAEYSERISFCFNDGEVLVLTGAGDVDVVSDPFDVPNPGSAAPAMPPTHVARTPVPSERRERSLVNQQTPLESPNFQRPPAQPEPDDFTPRPLQTLDVDPSSGPATPMYSPPAGMDLDEVPLAPEPAPVTSAPPPKPKPTPAPQKAQSTPVPAPPSQDSTQKSTLVLLVVAGVAVIAALLFLITVVMGMGISSSGEDETTSLAGAIEAAPAEVVEAPDPTPEQEPEDMEIPIPDPLDLGLPAEPTPEPVASVEPDQVAPTEGDPEGEATGEEGTGADNTAPEPDPTDAVAVVEPVPVTDDNPWGTPEPPVEPAPASEGRVAFSSSPSGAELLIDGEYRGATPLTQVLSFGDHEVMLRLAGHVSQRQTLAVGEPTMSLAMTLPKIEVSKTRFEAPGRDGDTLFIDGRPVGTIPREVELSPGSHTFTVEGPGGPRLTVTREITAGDSTVTLQ